MRQLTVDVPQGKGKDVLDIARKHHGVNLSLTQSTVSGETRDLAAVNLPNARIESFIAVVDDIPDARITLAPTGVVPMYPPEERVENQATDISSLSPLEVYLYGLMSVGSWHSFIGYAIAAGIIVWVGLYTNTVYLLIAAMLVAPFAGPAMNTAIATSRGDFRLLWRSLFRYIVSLLVAIAVAAVLSLALRQQIVTSMMISVSKLSIIHPLLMVAAGAAGALNQTQSKHNSLVSGAAVGMLVSASLAPAAGLIGMAAVIGRWDLVDNGLFSLLLTILGINLGGTAVFRLSGLTSRGARYLRGKPKVFYLIIALTVIAMAGLIAWQYLDVPDLQMYSREQKASSLIQETVDQSGMAIFVDGNVRFPPSSTQENRILLAEVYVKRANGVAASPAEIRQRLNRAISGRLSSEGFEVEPLIDITVLEGSDQLS
ncbi:MAG: hypothetical protein A4E28_02708 [Methanocella sp. PtaU1.Bin125]|nr:MAG: hypothetical protein A4E28_02708 [Methanocella sp. PtaU1.Bin125]